MAGLGREIKQIVTGGCIASFGSHEDALIVVGIVSSLVVVRPTTTTG